jgi:hypothetical protein
MERFAAFKEKHNLEFNLDLEIASGGETDQPRGYKLNFLR